MDSEYSGKGIESFKVMASYLSKAVYNIWLMENQ